MDEINGMLKTVYCSGCGTCQSLCLKGAIKLQKDTEREIYLPIVDKDKCNNCKICSKICPTPINNELKNIKQIVDEETDEFFIGNFTDCFIGHSKNENIRYNSSSGGLITQLLIFALEEGIIDGALVTRMKKDRPLEPEPFIARTKKEIIEASKSKYCPVPLNIGLKEIINSEKNEKFAIVGLPCHINGIKNACKINKVLEKRIHIILGIFCSHTETFKSTSFLFNEMKMKKNEIKKISYRGSGWPGAISLETKHKMKKIGFSNSNFNIIHNIGFFTPRSCLFCDDLTAELSDISFGDAWLPELMLKDKKGESIIITRSNRGKMLINSALNEDSVNLKLITTDKLIESQKGFLHFKKINIRKRIALKNLFNNKYPYSANNTSFSNYNNILALWISFNYLIGSIFGKSLNVVPFKIFRAYYLVYSSFSALIVKKDFDKISLKNKKGDFTNKD